MKEKYVPSILLFSLLTLVVGNNVKAASAEERKKKIHQMNDVLSSMEAVERDVDLLTAFLRELKEDGSRKKINKDLVNNLVFSLKKKAKKIKEHSAFLACSFKEFDKKAQQNFLSLIQSASDLKAADNREKFRKELVLFRKNFNINLDSLTSKNAANSENFDEKFDKKRLSEEETW